MLSAHDLFAQNLTEILQATFPDHWWWDALRYLSALLTAGLILAYSRIGFGRDRPTTPVETMTIRIGICSYLAAVIPSLMTEIASLGQPIVPWRLPSYLIMNVFGWWYVRRRL